MKPLTFILFLLISPAISAENVQPKQGEGVEWTLPYSMEELADAIYKAEGGNKTSFPYGVRSINTHGNKEYARRITLNSIENGHRRWLDSGSKLPFLEHFGQRWCPPKAHKLNKYWLKNVRFFLGIR